jgi:hypothetical protein
VTSLARILEQIDGFTPGGEPARVAQQLLDHAEQVLERRTTASPSASR